MVTWVTYSDYPYLHLDPERHMMKNEVTCDLRGYSLTVEQGETLYKPNLHDYSSRPRDAV